MTTQADFKGLKFNKLTVISNAPSRKTPCGTLERRVMVNCECGKVKDLAWKSVKRGKIKSCGCLMPEKIDIDKNKIYNHWTILNEVKPYVTKEGKMRKVLARCICGSEKEVLLTSLRTGGSKSCGCMTDYSRESGYFNVNINSPILDMSLEDMNKRDTGSWKIIEVISAKRNEKREIVRTVKVQCKCGYKKVSLLNNAVKSKQCFGCSMKDKLTLTSDEDRILYRRLGSVYGSIKDRCNNPNSKDYKNYGGRGIKVEESFGTRDKFITFMINGGYTYDCKLEVDRKDNNGNYSSENCRLVLKMDNNRNQSRNVMNWEIVDKIRNGEYKLMSNKEVSLIISCSESTVKSVRNYKTWNVTYTYTSS